MIMKLKRYVGLLALALLGVNVSAQKEGLTQFKLDNGLTVYMWEDHNQADVSGYVVVRAGSIDEPVEYTGLAHYLEHVLFKGTQEIGALDWEKEKPLYEEIIKLYDDFSDSTDPVVREELTKKINEVSKQAAQYGATDDFSNLIEGMGGEGLNAGTNYDQTIYYNSFPAFQMEKWLTINSDRFINPVFRAFQAELENVFEEFNLYQDINSEHTRNFIFSHLYAGHPYERDIIGTAEHLKNPRLSKLIEFYNTWYVPENMALVLVGNFDTETTKPLVEKTFGRLEKKSIPARQQWKETDFTNNPKFTAKLGYYPQIVWGFKGVPKGHPDELALEMCVSLLSNSMSTGLLDKLTMDGDVQGAAAILDSRRDQGRILVFCVPYFDANLRTYESDRATEKIIFQELDKLRNGNIEDWLIQSVKDEYARSFDLMLESSYAKSNLLMEAFTYNIDVDEILGWKDKVMAMTKEDIQQVAKQYFAASHMTLSIEEGTPKKNKLKKPSIDPLDPPKGVETAYSKMLKELPMGHVQEVYNNFNDVTKIGLYDRVNLFYTKNKANDIFSLTLKYGVGTEKMPKLEYATQLMNTAGIMPDVDAQTFRRKLGELGASCSYSVSDDYFTISILGKEENLTEICKLITQQILLPKLDDKQLNNVKGYEISSRMVEQKDNETQADALLEYVLYKDKSNYIDRMSIMDIIDASLSTLTGEIIRATEYAVDIHYVGQKPVNEVKDILVGNLPMKEGVKASESPLYKTKEVYEKPMLFFLPNSNMQQAKIYFYVDGVPYEIASDVDRMAFNQYFSGGFSGLVMNEIREKRSMAYTAYGYMSRPPLTGKKTCFLGYIGTQHDKVADAVDVFMDLLTNMPDHPERLENIQTYLRQSMLTDKPSFRAKSQVFDAWQRLGYTADPALVNKESLDALTYERIQQYYNNNIKGKPVCIVIMGDPKLIDMKSISSKYGKTTKLSKGKLFSAE